MGIEFSKVNLNTLRLQHPKGDLVEYRTSGNIRFDGQGYTVAQTSLPLERIQESFDKGYTFADTLKTLFNV